MSGGERSEPVYRFGVFELDLGEKELRKHGTRVKLQGQPFLVLTRLLQNANRLVTREELRCELWPQDTFVDFDHSLNEAVNKLRFALGDSATSPRFVETVPKHGYRFIAPVEEALHATPEVEPPIEPQGPEPPARPRGWATPVVGVGIAALVLAALFVRVDRTPAPAPVAVPLPGSPSIRSVAVLPFDNLSGDPAQDYFSDGMTEELIGHLSMLESLRVISPTSVRRYKASDKSVGQIAAELGVDAVIEGSVRLSQDRVRVTVYLTDPRTEQSLWSQFYDGETDDLFMIQMDVAESIASAVLDELTSSDAERLASLRERTPEAYQAYLKGRYHWNRRTEADFLKAIEYFNQALGIEPDYAEAYAGLSDTYSLLAVYNIQRHERAMPRAKKASLDALAIDPELAEAHASLGCIEFLYEWDFESAESEFRRALDLNPSYATAHQCFGVFLVSQGRTAEALETLRGGLELDPMSLSLNENLGWALYVARRYPEAIAQFESTLDLDPEYGQALRYLGLLYLYLGRSGEGLETLERARHAFQGDPEIRADLALAHALAGRPAEAEALLDELLEEESERYVSPFLIAQFHVGLGHTDEALDWLERAYEGRVANLVFLAVDPFFDSLRAHPRFRDLLRRIGLDDVGVESRPEGPRPN